VLPSRRIAELIHLPLQGLSDGFNHATPRTTFPIWTEQCKLFDEDARQEATLNILKLSGTDPIRSPKRYARWSVRSTAIRHRTRRREKRISDALTPCAFRRLVCHHHWTNWGRRMTWQPFARGIEVLAPRQRKAIELVYL
jgi:DNA-directed RNA polymerase specialized sigma24 family protein